MNARRAATGGDGPKRVRALRGATVYAFGDSIVRGHAYDRGFVDLVAEREGMTVVTHAQNGATIGPSHLRILDQVRRAGAAEPDYIVFDGGTNDAEAIFSHQLFPVGSIRPDFDVEALDLATFAGAFEATIALMKTRWPATRIIYTTAHKLGSRDWATQLALREVALRAARKWGVSLADVFADSLLDTREDDQRVRYTFDDLVDGVPGTGGTGTHPNMAGMVQFYVPVLTEVLTDDFGGADTRTRLT